MARPCAIEPRTQMDTSGGIAVAVVVAVDVVDEKNGHGHGHDQVYDHDPPRLPRDYGLPQHLSPLWRMWYPFRRARVAQLVEHRLPKPRVAGPSPVSRSGSG